jgi:hypothetical protein
MLSSTQLASSTIFANDRCGHGVRTILKTLAFHSFQISQDDNISNGTIPFSPPPMHLGDHRKPTTPSLRGRFEKKVHKVLPNNNKKT